MISHKAQLLVTEERYIFFVVERATSQFVHPKSLAQTFQVLLLLSVLIFSILVTHPQLSLFYFGLFLPLGGAVV